MQISKLQRRRGCDSTRFLLLPLLLQLLLTSSSSLIDGFVQNHNIRRRTVQSLSRIRGISLSRSLVKGDVVNDITNREDDTPSTPQLHQDTFQQDPDWYSEYVVGILGDTYCAERWAIDTSKKTTLAASASSWKEKTTGTADGSETSVKAPIKEDTKLETKATTSTAVNQSPPKVKSTSKSEDTARINAKDSKTISSSEKDPEMIASKTFETDEKLSSISKNATFLGTETSSEDSATANATANNDGTGQKTVVYRNIVGNDLTYVPLQNLTKLGYSITELEKMQSDSLCVVVNDQIRNPRMGVPLQWCLSDKNAPPQVQVVDSIQEALALMGDDEASQLQEKRQEREDNLQKKKKRKSSDGSKSQYRRDQKKDNPLDAKARRRHGPRPSQKEGRRQRQTDSNERMEVVSSKGSSWRNGATEDASDKNGNAQRRPDRRRSKLQRDGSPKPIYNGRDPYGGAMQRKKKDRGDPPAPKKVWMDLDTFKDLLRKEAEFRMRLAGEKFAPDIKRESDWRLELYKDWLWKLHDGIGEGLAPPSRYERARKMQRRGGVYKAERDDDIGRDTARTPRRERATPKRKSGGSGPPRPR